MLETWFCLTQASSAQLITSFNNVEPLTPAVVLSLPWEALAPTRPSPAQTAVGISRTAMEREGALPSSPQPTHLLVQVF